MRMKIVVLEDNAERSRVMRDCLVDRFRQYEPVFFVRPKEALAYLAEHLGEVLLISLDHDMELVPDANGALSDPGSGREVADYLATQNPTCPLVLHTSNGTAAIGMQSVLEEAGWTTWIVAPYEHLAWIEESWYPTVRRAIVNFAQPLGTSTAH